MRGCQRQRSHGFKPGSLVNTNTRCAFALIVLFLDTEADFAGSETATRETRTPRSAAATQSWCRADSTGRSSPKVLLFFWRSVAGAWSPVVWLLMVHACAGNRCSGDSDLDRTLAEIKCEFRSPGSRKYESGAWPDGWCHPLSSDCKALGVSFRVRVFVIWVDAAACVLAADDAFDRCATTCVESAHRGARATSLRRRRWAFDSRAPRLTTTASVSSRVAVCCGGEQHADQIGFAGKGTIQAKNICILSRYGNLGKITDQPTKNCEGRSLSGASNQVHW